MLFDDVFEETEWNGKDSLAKIWKEEIDKRLEFIKSKGQINRFKPRLNSTETQRGEALAEILSAYVLEEILSYRIIEWEKPTIGGKNVDLFITDGVQEIYAEVKSPSWEAELSQEERLSKRKLEPKYIDGEARSLGSWQNIQYAIIKANEKFIFNKNNLVVLSTDLFISPLVLPRDLNIYNALYRDSALHNNLTKKDENGCFSDNKYENIGGVLFIENYLFCKDRKVTYKYNFFNNRFSLNPFDIKT